jgi:dipeptidyl aminopeptidase/acylaminoacyl peptidase
MPLKRLVCLALCAALQAQSPWTPEDYARTAWPGEARLTADGRDLVFTVEQPDARAQTRPSQVWRVHLGGGGPTQLAPRLVEAKAPRPGPDGRIALLGTGPADKGLFQVHLSGPAGFTPLTARPRGVQGLEWRNAGHLILAMEDAPDSLDRSRLAGKDDAVVVDDESRPIPLGLWDLELRTRQLRRISHTPDRIGPFKVSPDGRFAVARHERGTRWEYDQKVPPVTRVWDLETGACTELPVDPQVIPDDYAWAPDSRSFYAVHRHFTHPYLSQAGIQAAYRASLPDWRPIPLPLAWDRGLGPTLQPLDGGLLVTLEDGLDLRIAFLGAAGGAPRLFPNGSGAYPEQLLADATGQRGAVLLSSATHPPQWYAVTFGQGTLKVGRQLTQLNPHLADKRMARVERYRVAGAAGPVEGLLYYPADYQPGRAYPLVLNPHGGPALHDADDWNENDHHPAQLHAQAGAFVLKLNYSGSTGYGLAFAERLMGRYLGPELVDLKAAMADLVARGLVDPARIGLTGWSNGAILGWALAVDSPYPLKAAALGAGDVSFASDWSNCQFGESFDAYYLGTSFVDDPEVYWRRSTLRQLGRVRTPVLILHGEKDREVPTEQAWQGFRFLQQAGKAPVRLVLFPGEGHDFRQPPHIRRRLEEELAWFATHFYRQAQP